MVVLYSNRWQIEPLFHNLKRWWGINNLWQQKRRVLERWMQIRCIAWAMVQLLAETVAEDFPTLDIAPSLARRHASHCWPHGPMAASAISAGSLLEVEEQISTALCGKIQMLTGG